MEVGFIGLGRLGTQLVDCLVEARLGQLNLFDTSPQALEKYSTLDVGCATCIADVADSDIVGVCVQDDAQVRDVVTAPDGLLAAPMRPGAVIAVHSTVHPDTCRDLNKEAEAVGIKLIDAAVSNGGRRLVPGPETMTRLVAVGADKSTFEYCLGYLQALGDFVEHAGPVGSGQVVKLLNNLLMTANMGMTAEAIRCGEQLGLSHDVLVRSFSSGSGSSQGIRLLLPAQRAPHHNVLLSKDVSHAIDILMRDECDSTALQLGADVGLAALAAHNDDGRAS